MLSLSRGVSRAHGCSARAIAHVGATTSWSTSRRAFHAGGHDYSSTWAPIESAAKTTARTLDDAPSSIQTGGLLRRLSEDPNLSRVKIRRPDGQDFEFDWGPRGFLFRRHGHYVYAQVTEAIRDSCSCTACRDESSGQKSFSTTQLPLDMAITNVTQAPDGGLIVKVDKDMDTHGGAEGHDVKLSPFWVLNQMENPYPYAPLQEQLANRYHPTFWDAANIKDEICRIDYDQFMQEDSAAFWDVIRELMRLGIVMLSNVPRDEESVSRIANRIALIRETFYGRTFDVRAKPNAENIAYTSGYLGLHQDLLYLNPPPFIQILHCMDNSCSGGESLFSDADRIGRVLYALRGEYPVINYLTKVHIPYGYRRDGHWYFQRRPMLETDPNTNTFAQVFWSPPFQAEMTHRTRPDMWIRPARIFEEAVNDPEALYETKMQPGDCVLFNNLRVLHGRRAFDSEGGNRWLRGAYVSKEDFMSTASRAPDTHAAPLDEPHTWWSPTHAQWKLRKTPIYRKIHNQLQYERSTATENLR